MLFLSVNLLFAGDQNFSSVQFFCVQSVDLVSGALGALMCSIVRSMSFSALLSSF